MTELKKYIEITGYDKISEIYKLRDTRDWKISENRKALADDENWESYITQCLYRPFDTRAYYNSKYIVELPRSEVMQHVSAKPNVGLIANRQVRIDGIRHFLVSNVPVDFHVLETAHAAAPWPAPPAESLPPQSEKKKSPW